VLRFGLALTLLCAVPLPLQNTLPAPDEAVAELLASDRAFSAASAKTDVVSGLAAMFGKDVVMQVPGNRFTRGMAEAVTFLRSNADNAKSRVEWVPARAGISADGLHGFTFGFMTQQRPDGTKVPLKYMAYWIKGNEGWRVAVYKRRPRPEGDVPADPMPPSLPARMVAPATDAAVIKQLQDSLADAERAFSLEAQTIGLGPAFVKYGSRDAVNMGGPDSPGFVIGSEAIGKAVSGGEPATGSSVSWGPETVLVASSGDVGVSIGFIRLNKPPADGTAAAPIPFFTIWRRPDTASPWRYIAE
jgi:ketosteroid isomerase-like protein